ncbi:hypothetical protein CC80DRAFT_554142 [Byssothecium circinans]|uniref:DUF6594 domain-containing protein n=1 Tax=Byssothecium circinans TaxID=147558 RepID=A0A6A5TER4_9PLEO|nr:hypothetical protein CC80DRAFT_554142 [Byssothecium circinans]
MAKKEKPAKAPEKPLSDPLANLITGYPKLAGRMAIIPETAMFRRFGALNARNLLYLQSDLISLEEDLIKLEGDDSKSEEGKKKEYALDHYWLRSSREERDGDTKQRELVLEMRETLKEYNHALIQQASIMQLNPPDAYDINHLQHFLSSEAMGPLHLCGPDRYVWGSYLQPKDHSKELVVLRPRVGADSFSRLTANHAISFMDKFVPARFKKIDKDSAWRVIIASLAPVVSIIVLTTISSLRGRLGTIAAFNVLVAVFLTLLTDARRTDVFSVTAAFAAVQVVFVGQALDHGVKKVYCVPSPP